LEVSQIEEQISFECQKPAEIRY